MKLKKFIIESIEELRFKVTWPKFSDLQNSSVLVLVSAIIFALVIWVIDTGFESAMRWFYNEF